MTLIISELSPLGIVMVADNAITFDCYAPNGTFKGRSFKGLTKLLPVAKIQAGLSYWGWANVCPYGDINKGIPFDWWLSNFLMVNDDKFDNLEDLANLLETELRKIIPKIDENPLSYGGIHLAGFSQYKGNLIPDFWHIHNGASQALSAKQIDSLIVNANHDCPVKKTVEFFSKGMFYMTRNGELEIFIPLFDSLNEYIREEFHKYDFITPIPNVLARADYYKSQLQLLSTLYQISGKIEHTKTSSVIYEVPVSVSNEVTILTISKGRINNYFTS